MGIEELNTKSPLHRIAVAADRMADALETIADVLCKPTVTTTDPMPEVWDPRDCASFKEDADG